MEPGYILIDEQNSIEELIRLIAKRTTVSEPLNVLNLDDIVWKHCNWQRKLPSVAPYYAVKCNSHPVVLRLLAALGCGFDCASKTELEAIVGLDVCPDRIVFAHPAKPIESIRYAKRIGVKRMTFDSADELEKVAAHFPDAELLLRIRHDAREAQLSLGRKFGADPDREAKALLTCAQTLRLRVIGVSFHVGSGSMDAECFYDGIRKALSIFDIAQTIGIQMHLLDIGGGFPGANDAAFDEHVHFINKALEEFVHPRNGAVTVIAEPGKYYVQSAITALVHVISKSYEKDAAGNVSRIRYYVDDGLYDTFDWCDGPVNKVVLQEDKYRLPPVRSVIYGRTMCERDVICADTAMPEHEVGDCLIFPNKGAYGKILGSGHNGFSPARTKVCLTRTTLNYICAEAVKAVRG